MIPPRHPDHIRLVSYNIQWGMGADDVGDLDRIVTQLERMDADIAILNEVDVNWRRSDNVDQPDYIQKETAYPYAYYGPALSTWASGNLRVSHYGNLLLSRFPIVSASSVKLPRAIGREPRAAIVAQLDVDGRPWIVVGTHLGLRSDERKKQTETILRTAERWVNEATIQSTTQGVDGDGAKIPEASVVIMGDFNARPDASELTPLQGTNGPVTTPSLRGTEHHLAMFDAFALAGHGPGYTFPYPEPYARIDYVFVSEDLADHIVGATELALPGSDHLPVVVDVAPAVTLPVSAGKDRIWTGWRSVPCRKTAE